MQGNGGGMSGIDKNRIPEHIKKIFTEKGIDAGRLIYSAYGDMKDGRFIDVWVAFDEENFYILTGMEKVDKVKGKRRLDVSFDLQDFEEIPVRQLGKLKIERYLSTASLVSVKEEKTDNDCLKDSTAVSDDILDTFEIATFSIGFAVYFENLIKLYENFKEGKDIYTGYVDIDQELFCPKCGTRYPEKERRVCPKCLNKMNITVRLFSFFKSYKKKVILIIATMLAGTAFSLVSPYVGSKLLFDEVLTKGGKYYGYIGLIVIAIFFVRFIGVLLGALYSYILAGIIPQIIYDIKIKIFSAMQRLSVGFYTSKQTGSLMARVNNDSTNIYWFFVDGLPYVIVNTIMLTGIVILMFLLNVKLAVITLVSIPVIIVVFRSMWRIFKKLHHKRWVYDSKMSSHVSDSLNGQRIIKSFAKEDVEKDRFGGFSNKLFGSELKLENTAFTAFPLIYLFMFGAQVAVTAVGGVMVINGQLTLGTLLTFIAYIGMLYGPMEFLSWVSNWWARCIDSAQRVFEIVDARPDVEDCEDPVVPDQFTGDIEVSGVKFEYEPARPVINGMSFGVSAGQMLGIVGKTGSGKSTIVNLIARLYDVKEGHINIDGINVKKISLEQLRKNVGLVSQEIYLFMGTIADNIRYAKPDAPIEEVVAAAKAASAHDFIMKLPDAYETRIGAGGQDLSGGEKQRLSIARTIIQNPKILILDEATAAMDTITERNIQNSLSKLKTGRTTIAIAHRLSTLRDADMLAVISEGKVIEYGTPVDLINKKGEYFKLFALQMDALKHVGIGE
jgi:ATP-binding cassette, subfamily B, bacterial